MTELSIVLLTAFFGIVGAVIGYALISFFLEPVKDFRNEIRILNSFLLKYRNTLLAPDIGDLHKEASQALRSVGITLQSKMYAIPAPRLFRLLRLIPHEMVVADACKSLFVLSQVMIADSSNHDTNTVEFGMKLMRDEKTNVIELLKIKTY